MKHLISMRDLSRAEILHFMKTAAGMESGELKVNLDRKVMAALFYEPSTRTRMSFESAMKKLGGKVVAMIGTSGTSVEKGETLADTTKVVARYSDIVVIRHPMEGAARYVSEQIDLPVVNAGDGANQHPTQSLLDLYSIQKTQGKLDNLKVAMLGDLKYGRTVHSLSYALAGFNPSYQFIAPDTLRMPAHICDDLTKMGISFTESDTIGDMLDDADILYVTRIQKERFPDREEYEKVKNAYIIQKKLLQNVKPNFRVLHPLPRVNEIATDVDNTPYAYYFDQAENGVYIRQAILATLLGEVSL